MSDDTNQITNKDEPTNDTPKAEEVVEEVKKEETAEKAVEEAVEGTAEETASSEEVAEEDLSKEIDIEDLSKEEVAPANPIEDFRIGDTIRVNYKIIEGNKTRVQPYQGIVISKRGADVSKTFTVRKIGADGVGVERIFVLNSPNIVSLKVMKKGKVRRAKLFYLRDKKGREAMRIKERI